MRLLPLFATSALAAAISAGCCTERAGAKPAESVVVLAPRGARSSARPAVTPPALTPPAIKVGPRHVSVVDVHGERWTFLKTLVARITPDFGDPNYARLWLDGGAIILIHRDLRESVEAAVFSP